ncbi:MAG: J domain-containing protein [Bdellovibrionota bacterium]
MIDPYKVLGVSKSASQDDIKKAHRTLAKKTHPDLNPGKKDLEEKFKEISFAYELIGTPEAREKFDRGETVEQQQEQQREQARSYASSQQQQGRYSRAFEDDMGSDFFENIFRQSQGARGGRGAPADFPGEDQTYRMTVSFKDAALGAEREITLPTGKKLLVKIPAGINDGAKIRLKGQGGPGYGKAPAGDALVEIAIDPLAGFNRSGTSIETELPISFQEGILGGEVKVPTLEGSVMMTIKPGSSTGTRLRIRGKGAGSSTARGDQIVVLKVSLPSSISPELSDAIKKLGPQFNYNPRSET